MPDRWTGFCRRLVPAALRERAFDPAAADLRQEWTVRASAGRGVPLALDRVRFALRLVGIAMECRRLAMNLSWAPIGAPRAESRLTMWMRDVRRTFRMFGRQPLFAAAAILTLALGAGANLTIFGFVNSFFLAPLPARDPASLVRVYGVDDGIDRDVVSHPNYLDARKAATALDLAAHSATSVRVGSGDAVEVRTVELVTGNYFRVLGLMAASGRLLEERDDVTEGAHPVVVLSHGFWLSRFAGQTSAIGQKLTINGRPFDIVGVAPEGYRGTFSARAIDFWTPLTMHQTVRPTGLTLGRRGWGWLSMIGRRQQGADLAAVNHQLNQSAADIRARFPNSFSAKFDLFAAPASALNDPDREMMMPVLATVFGFTMLLMIVTCANLAGVMQARLSARRREMAIRQSLGAGRGRLAVEWLTECLCLAALGGLAGLIVARLTALVLGRIPLPLQILGDLSLETALDWRMVAYTGGLALGSGLVFGCAPAWRAGRLQAFPLLKDEGGTVAGGRRGARLRQAAVLVQVTVSIVLLSAAGLLSAALIRQHGLTPGFETGGLGIATFNLHNETPDARRDLTDRLLERVRRHPAVVSADVGATIPIGFDRNRMGIAVPGYVSPTGRRSVSIDFNQVGPGSSRLWGFRSSPGSRGRRAISHRLRSS